jgi:anti-anti-sigma factor
VLDDGEVFDSTLLKETVTNYVATGKNNVLIDLVQLDYIYSDSMNVIMSLNKSILETGGNFGLLQVRPEVIQILQKAGVSNTLRIFNSDDEVQNFSLSLMQSQQQGFAHQSPQSQSEFDQLRSEIGSVFGGSEQPTQDFGNQGYSQQTRSVQQTQNPYARPGFPTQQPQFQGRQYTPPPPPPLTPTRPIVPPPVQTGGIGGPQKPPVRPPFSTDQPRMGTQQQEYATETQRFPQVPQVPVQPKKAEPPIPASFNDELEEITSKAGRPRAEMPAARVDAIDIDDDILTDDHPKKKSPVGIIVAVVLLLALIGAGFYVVTSGILDNGEKPQQTAQKPATTPKPAVTPAPVAPQPAVTPEPTPAPALEPVKPEPVKTEPVKTEPVKTVKAEPVTPKKIVKKPVVAAEPVKKATVNKIQITSIPVGASISVNGEMIGKTPYTWDKPVYGPISIEISRAGYKSVSKDIEFTGGVIKESFTLERELPPPPPKPEPVPEPVPEPKRPEPVVTPTPAPTPTPTPAPEPEPEPAKVVSTPVVSTAGGDASIYFASLPPIAEVYLNGKLVGRTNVAELKLPSGTHVLRFVKGAKEVTQEITLQPGKNPSRLIRLP